jgi:hypothetical protein
MLGPSCLCPLKDHSMPDFVEAAIYSISKGPLAGKYVASCAEDKCGYFGEREHSDSDRLQITHHMNSVHGGNLQPSWRPKQELRTQTYVFEFMLVKISIDIIRSTSVVVHERAPPLITHKSERRPLKRSFAMLGKTLQLNSLFCAYCILMESADINAPDLVYQRVAPALGRRKSTSELLVRLDSRAGVTEAQFRGLFARCACGHYSTGRAFKRHVCAGEMIDLTEEMIDLTEEIIDLTGED